MKAHFIFWQKGPFEEFSAHNNNKSWLKKKKSNYQTKVSVIYTFLTLMPVIEKPSTTKH